jgi:hypothetical protein
MAADSMLTKIEQKLHQFQMKNLYISNLVIYDEEHLRVNWFWRN